MNPLDCLRPPRDVLTFFVILMTVCALGLGWLGWQVLVQDRAVEAQLRQEQLESIMDRGVTAIERVFANPDVELTIGAEGETEIEPAGRLAFTPTQPAASPIRPGLFADAEALEFAQQDRVKAAEAYRRLAESSDPQVRAEALVRLGRVLRGQRAWAEALAAYDSLRQLGARSLAGMPADLAARSARCSVLRERGDAAGAGREAARLLEDLTGGHWSLTKPTLETYLEELKALAPSVSFPADWEDRVALAETASWAFRQAPAHGRAGVSVGGRICAVAWERQNGVWKARLAAPSSWDEMWQKLERETGAAFRVTDSEGRALHSGASPTGPAAFRTAAMPGSSWNLTATLVARPDRSGAWTARRRLLIGGLAVFAVVLGAGALLIARAISREVAVARLQSDFVAAVSHEFRTPLTSVRQLLEMLAGGRITDDQQKQRAYNLMLGQSDRLGRLVECLLDFGRMQARKYNFRSEEIDAASWSRAVTQEFEQQVRDRGYAIGFQTSTHNTCIHGDREALGNALWNLLDNAVKYSPDGKRVEVALSAADGKIEVSVRDWGTGIAKPELKRVFGKFYRGANAKAHGMQGTGLGLAMVKEIVEAHGGTVRVRSEVGEGSEFTMVLPCRESSS